MISEFPQFKVVFPAPPPTTNELTAQQRTHLVRKTRKIEQLLGMTPRLLDASIRPPSPIHISFPYAAHAPQRRLTKTRRTSSIDSTSSASSSSSGSVSGLGSGPLASPVHRSSSLSTRSLAHYEYDNTAPLLRLAMESMSLESIPASPSPTPTRDSSFAERAPPRASSYSVNEEPSRIFALAPRESADITASSPRSSLVLSAPPSAPSASSLRKQKMDRLRKKLGAEVPFDLVFPQESISPSSSSSSSSENTPLSSRDKECPPLPAPTPRAARRTGGRIASSRDSISESVSIHRAARRHVISQARASSASEQRAPSPPTPQRQHKKSRSEHPHTPPPVLPSLHFKRNLSFIIESPDEHGAGCAEEFGITRTASSKSDTTGMKAPGSWLVQSYVDDSASAEFKIWSTRKGYEGWSAGAITGSKVNLAPIATTIRLAAPAMGDDSDDSSPSSSAPSSPRSSTGLNGGAELKRRPSSYRKPPPTITVELC